MNILKKIFKKRKSLEDYLLEGIRICCNNAVICEEIKKVEIKNNQIIVYNKLGEIAKLTFKRLKIKDIIEIEVSPTLFRDTCEILASKINKKLNNEKIFPIPAGSCKLTESVISVYDIERGLKRFNNSKEIMNKLGIE